MEEQQYPQSQLKRPPLLTALCILTFISTGFSVLGSVMTPAMADFMIGFVKKTPEYNPDEYTELFTLWKMGWGFYMTILLFSLLSLTGALLMWNLKKNGFHFYTIANIILFYLPVMWAGTPFNIIPAFMSASFIGMYALHLKYMH